MDSKFFSYIIVHKADRRLHYHVRLPVEKLAGLVQACFIAKLNPKYRGRQEVSQYLLDQCENFRTYIKFI